MTSAAAFVVVVAVDIDVDAVVDTVAAVALLASPIADLPMLEVKKWSVIGVQK